MKSYKSHCDCKHEFQDKEHGKGVRVCNPTKGSVPQGSKQVRCTVCSKLHTVKE